MAIVVAHDPGFFTAGLSSFLGGVGQRFERDRAFHADEKEREFARQLAAERQRLEAQAQASSVAQREKDREFSMDIRGVDQRHDIEMMAEREAQANRMLAQQSDMEELNYTKSQRRKIDQINQGIQWIKAQTDWPETQKIDGIRQLEAQLAGIQPMPTPREESPFPPGQGVGEMWEDDKGNVWTRDDKGIPKHPSGWKRPEDSTIPFSDYAKVFQSLHAAKSAASDSGNADMADVAADTAAIMTEWKRFSQPPPPPSPDMHIQTPLGSMNAPGEMGAPPMPSSLPMEAPPLDMPPPPPKVPLVASPPPPGVKDPVYEVAPAARAMPAMKGLGTEDIIRKLMINNPLKSFDELVVYAIEEGYITNVAE